MVPEVDAHRVLVAIAETVGHPAFCADAIALRKENDVIQQHEGHEEEQREFGDAVQVRPVVRQHEQQYQHGKSPVEPAPEEQGFYETLHHAIILEPRFVEEYP
jgi:hypothetical protein